MIFASCKELTKTEKTELNPTQKEWLPIACLVLAALLWASSFIALKLAFQLFHPMLVIFGRMALASICFLFFLGKFKGIRYRKGTAKYILLMCFCEPCLYFIFEARAIENTSASQAGMITAMLPLMVAIAASLFLKEPVSKKTLSGFVMTILGACWLSLSSESSQAAPNPILGNFFEFVAMICAAGYIVTFKRLAPHYSPFLLTGIQAFVGSIFYLPVMLTTTASIPMHIEPAPALAVVYLGTVVTLGAYGLNNFGVSRIPASQASAFANLIPVFSVFLAWLILGERFTLMQYAASLMVMAGVIISQESRSGPVAVKAT